MRATAFNIRTTEATKDVIKRASSMLGVSTSSFMVQTATEKAYEVIKSQNIIKANDEQWEHFCAVLNRPQKFSQKLYDLMHKPSVSL